MKHDHEKGFHPEPVPMVLSDANERDIMRQMGESERKVEEEIFGGERPFDRMFKRPPGRDDLSWTEAREMLQDNRSFWSRLLGKARNPRSRIMLPSNAWAWDLRKFQSKTDELIRSLLKNYDLFLCRYIMSLVEDNEEKIKWASIKISSGDSVVYRMWPTESYKSNSSVDVTLSGKIGLTRTLEVIELPVGGEAKVVWQGSWKWASAIIKSWGIGDTSAGWRLERDISAPFSGDREFYLLLQLPRGEKPSTALASLNAKIKPSGLERSFDYHTDPEKPVEINYHVA